MRAPRLTPACSAVALLLWLGLGCDGDRAPGRTFSEAEALASGLPVRTIDPEATQEQLRRRARSIARLRREGVPVLESLPTIEAEAECRFRTPPEILDRALALLVVSSRAGGDPEDFVRDLERRYGTARLYTPEERAFMSGPVAPDAAAQLHWRMEALRVLLWALGYLDSLPTPSAPIEAQALASPILSRTREELLADARPRSQAEILDWADLIYRYAWANVETRLNGAPPPPGVNPDVVMEWHHALNWLIGYQGQAWDDVSTDT